MQEKLISKNKLIDELRVLRTKSYLIPCPYNTDSEFENELAKIVTAMIEEYHINLVNELEIIMSRCETDKYPCGLCKEFTEEESKD